MDLTAIGVSREIRNDEDAKGRTNHPAIFKQSYTHHYSIQRLVQLSPPPMPSSSQANVMSAPFDRIQKIRFVQGATMGKGIVAVLRQRPREKFRFVSGSGFFHGRVAHPCARVCVRVDVHASCTVGVPRSTNRLSMYAWVISNGMETEPGGNKGDGGTVSIISLGIARYGYYRVSPLRQISRGRGWNVAGISSGTKKRKKKNVLLSNDVKFCENNFIKQSRGGFRLSVILRQVHENLPASGILEWTKFLRPNSRDIEQSVPSVKYRSEN